MSQTEMDSLKSPDQNGRTSLGRYELLTKFATGGMAELYLAREHGAGGMERMVVIKRLLPHLAEQPESVEQFSREGRLVSRLQHPNVIQTHEFGEDRGEYFLAMEYLHGSTLRELQWLAQQKEEADGIPLWFAASAIEQACRGLHAAHELRNFEGDLVKLIHRDVSPQNLMCTVDGFVKLLDFGVAKGAEGEEATNTGKVRGKFAYMSPEQFHLETLDRRSDIFALGIVCWELFTGERLFKRETKPQMMEAIIHEQPSPPSSVAPDVPEGFDAVLERALQKDREERPETAEIFRQELVEVAERHDLLRDPKELAPFVQSVAEDRLATRDTMIKESLERSLTTGERARLRHEQGVDSTRPEAVEETRPGDRESGSSSSEWAAGSEGSATGLAPTRTDRPPELGRPEERASPGDSETSGRSNRWRWGVVAGLAGMAVLVSAAILFWANPEPSFWTNAEENAQASETSPKQRVEVSGPPLSYVYPPVQTDDVVRSELAPLIRYLERELGRPVETVVSESYADAAKGLLTGRYDVATLPPLTFVLTRRAEPSLEALALREEADAVTNDGLLLVRKSSGFQSLKDLRGKTFCFTDRTSTSGNFLPRVEIRRRGWKPDEFIGNVHWSGNHLQVLKDLENGTCEAAATYSGSVLSGRAHGVRASKLRTVAITGHLPGGTLTVRPGLSEELTERLKTIHLRFDPETHAGTKVVGKTLELTGFRKAREKLYKPLAQAVENHSEILDKFGLVQTDRIGTDASTHSRGADAGAN